MPKGSLFSTSLPTFIISRLFKNRSLNGCVLTSHCSFDLNFSANEWCWISFHVPFGYLCVFLPCSPNIFVVVVQLLSRVWHFVTPVDCSTPGFPVLHYLPEFVQTHVHWVGDAIQPSHPLSSPSPPALSFSQHQGLFQWVLCSLYQVTKILKLQLQHQSFSWIFRVYILWDWLVWSPILLKCFI